MASWADLLLPEERARNATGASDVQRLRTRLLQLATGIEELSRSAAHCMQVRNLSFVAADMLAPDEKKAFDKHRLHAKGKEAILARLYELRRMCEALMKEKAPSDPVYVALWMKMVAAERGCRACQLETGRSLTCPVAEEMSSVGIDKSGVG
jgi:hypothetical protein